MWCTRWFLPLLLLPLPTAPPFFLVLFLISLTIHAKPCFYCIILLSTLFFTSCYWQPFPIDTPLSVPWADNISTFAEALNATIMPNYTKPLPTVMRPVDRCWCDYAARDIFEPYNVSHWEYRTVKRLVQSLEREQMLEDTLHQQELQARKRAEMESFFITQSEDDSGHQSTEVPKGNPPTPSSHYWSHLKAIVARIAKIRVSPVASLVSKYTTGHLPTPPPQPPKAPLSSMPQTRPPTPPQVPTGPPTPDSLIRKEYDLRPYGLGIIIDLGWTR